MKNIIQKAIEGGYRKDYIWPTKWPVEKMLLDPLFWQALGKSAGWEIYDQEKDLIEHYQWYMRAIEFHRINLTEGWDKAVSWLEDLIK